MVDFHQGYNLGAVTVPLHSLNLQLKMIAKQLASLSELHGALAAQVSVSLIAFTIGADNTADW